MSEVVASMNAAGAELGVNGFVICQTCGKEVQEISRESGPEYAYCLSHRARSTFNPYSKEEQCMKTASKTTTKPVKKSVKKQDKKSEKKAAKKGKTSKRGELMAKLRARAPVTRDEVIKAALDAGLTRKHGTDAAWYLNKEGLIKAAA